MELIVVYEKEKRGGKTGVIERNNSYITCGCNGNISQPSKTNMEKKKPKNHGCNEFSSSASVANGYYGRYNAKGEFIQLGKEISIESVIYCLESEELFYELSFEFAGKHVKRIMERGKVFDPKEIIKLNKYGADCPTKNISVIIDTLRKKEDSAEKRAIHKGLGWLAKGKMCFRADKLYGRKLKSQYDGSVDVTSKGTFEEWRNMVTSEVLGHVELETLLVATLSSVVVGLISDETTKENPIINYSARSGSGKTTVACLMASAGGKPFHGCEENKNGEKKTSLLQSWSTTSNAIIADQSGNTGYPIIIDELSKIGKTDLSQLVYSFSEGTQKKRMTSSTDVDILPSFRTTIISLGECQLLSKKYSF